MTALKWAWNPETLMPISRATSSMRNGLAKSSRSFDGSDYAMGVAANRCEMAHAMALLADQQPVDDLANDQRSQHPILLGQLEQPQ